MVLSDDEIEMDLSKFFPKFYTDIFASLCSCVANGLVDPNMLKLVSSCFYRDEDLLIMEKEPIRIFVNDAMGNFGGALLRLIASGVMLGEHQPVILYIIDVSQSKIDLNATKAELRNAGYPLLRDVIANGKVIQASKAVLVVSGDANTNALIVKRDAPRIPTKNITCLTRLEHNRALCSISKRLRVEVTDVKNVIIWGMNSSTRNLDVNHARVKIPGSEKSVHEIVNDDAWLDGVAVKSEQQSDPSNTITKDTELLMAACDHIRDWVLGTSKDTWISMGVYSDGSLYNVPAGIFFSFPVTCVGGELCWW